ncbi:MAG: hypothetical protein NDF52_05285 [archaeon YNP-WB-062]|jgi:hypothetical protein|nr:hypothetical protein [Candidatus Culexarchaeum yellowstonense]
MIRVNVNVKCRVEWDKCDRIIIEYPYYSTIDLDYCDKGKLARIIAKIIQCKWLIKVKVRDTNKGYHLILFCKRKCELCRMAFDDQTRFFADFNRPLYLRNILWTRKRPVLLCEVFKREG